MKLLLILLVWLGFYIFKTSIKVYQFNNILVFSSLKIVKKLLYLCLFYLYFVYIKHIMCINVLWFTLVWLVHLNLNYLNRIDYSLSNNIFKNLISIFNDVRTLCQTPEDKCTKCETVRINTSLGEYFIMFKCNKCWWQRRYSF